MFPKVVLPLTATVVICEGKFRLAKFILRVACDVTATDGEVEVPTAKCASASRNEFAVWRDLRVRMDKNDDE